MENTKGARVIINPLDKKMMADIVASEALAGKDSFCMNCLKEFRARYFLMKLLF